MKIVDHSVYWFFPFQFATESTASTGSTIVSLDHLRTASWCARPHANGASESEKSISIWEPEDYPLKSDLLPHVKRLLGMDGPVSGNATQIAYPPMRLTDKAMGVLGNKKHNFAFALSKSADRRMGLPEFKGADVPNFESSEKSRWVLPFKFGSARVFRFGTGTGLLILEIAYNGVEREDGSTGAGLPASDPNIILEGNHLLGNPSRDGEFLWRASFARGKKDNGFIQNVEFSLNTVARTLLDGIANEPITASRLYSYSAVILEDCSTDEYTTYACRLARRYTTDYAINVNGFSTFSPFADVIHAAEYEGSASLADCSKSAEFVGDYLNKVVRPTLLPMLVLAQHEHNFLLHLMETCSTGYLAEKDEGKRAEFLRSRRAKYLDYRLNYRFDYAARLTPQNGVYQFWRKALRADEIVVDLDTDLASIAAIETERHQARQERESAIKHLSAQRWEKIKIAIMSGVGVYLVVDKITTPHIPMFSQVISILVSILSVGISWRLSRSVEIPNEFVEVAEKVTKTP